MLLEVANLTVAYGKAVAVRDVSFTVAPGQFVTMLGRNGAGKSTILHAISGLVPKRAGQVRFAGEDITHSSARHILGRGLVQVLEGHRVFTTLTVEDNLRLGTYGNQNRATRPALDRIYALFPELADRRRQPAARLSGGQQQILAVAQGIIAEPKLLILDEPSGGLAPILIDRVLSSAAALSQAGVAILLIEQLVEKALAHADAALLIETGEIAARGTAKEIAGSDTLLRHYLGAG